MVIIIGIGWVASQGSDSSPATQAPGAISQQADQAPTDMAVAQETATPAAVTHAVRVAESIPQEYRVRITDELPRSLTVGQRMQINFGVHNEGAALAGFVLVFMGDWGVESTTGTCSTGPPQPVSAVAWGPAWEFGRLPHGETCWIVAHATVPDAGYVSGTGPVRLVLGTYYETRPEDSAWMYHPLTGGDPEWEVTISRPNGRAVATAPTLELVPTAESLPAGSDGYGGGIVCRDGWVSHAAHTRGACSHHGGIAR